MKNRSTPRSPRSLTMNVTPQAATPTSVVPPFSGSLDDLLALDTAALAALYQSARVPRLTDVSGDLRGRMLSVVGLPAPIAGPVRMFAGSSVFPWRGKSFLPQSAERGEGI